MNVLRRQKLSVPAHVLPGDSIQVTEHYADGTERVLVRETIAAPHVFDEAAIFEAEFEGRYALGGLLIEEQRP
jgi:hypothetical protein